MTESGENFGRILNYVEKSERSETQNSQMIAALALEGLALSCDDPDEAEGYFGRAQHAYERIKDSEGTVSEYPTQAEVVASAHTSLVTPLHRLLVEKELSDVAEMQQAYAPFIRGLGEQARAAHKLLYMPTETLSPELIQQLSELSAIFNGMAVVGLLMRFQIQKMQSDSWMPMPSFIEIDGIRPKDDNPITEIWHANIWGTRESELHRLYKIYVRSVRESKHGEIQDEDTALVWISSDLSLPPDKGLVSPLQIIRELATPKEKGKRYMLDSRTTNLLAVIDERTISST